MPTSHGKPISACSRLSQPTGSTQKAYRVARRAGCTVAVEQLGRLAFEEDLFWTTDLLPGKRRPLREADFPRLMRFHDHIWRPYQRMAPESRP